MDFSYIQLKRNSNEGSDNVTDETGQFPDGSAGNLNLIHLSF